MIAGVEVIADRCRDVVEGLRGVTVPRCESRQIPGVVRLKQPIAGLPRNLRSQTMRLKRAIGIRVVAAIALLDQRPVDGLGSLSAAVGVAKSLRGLVHLIRGVIIASDITRWARVRCALRARC